MTAQVAASNQTPYVTATSITALLPAGVQAGWLLGVTLYWSSPNLETISAPSGWTADQNGTVRSNTAGLSTATYWKVAVANEPNPVFTLSAQTRADAVSYGITGAPSNIAAAIAASAVAKETTSTATHVTPVVTVPSDNTLLLQIGGDRPATATTDWTVGSNLTELAQSASAVATASAGIPSTVLAQVTGLVAAGQRGGNTLTATQADAKAITWSIAINSVTVASAQTVMPSADVIVDPGIVAVGITPTTPLYPAIAEATLDTTSYINWPAPDGAHAYGANFAFAGTSLPSLSFDISYRTPGATTVDVLVEVRTGTAGTLVATRHLTDVSATQVITKTITLTPSEVALITDPANVRVRVTPTVT